MLAVLTSAVLILAVTVPLGSVTATASARQPAASKRISDPVRLHVGAVGINASIIRLGLNHDKTLQVPGNASQSGWFTGSPRPGAQGPAVVVGHVHWNGQPGVFANLGKLDYGDRIVIRRTDGSRAVFRVTRVSRFKKSQFPSELVYGNVDGPELRLITCDGFDARGHVYLDNLVVFAMLLADVRGTA